MAVVQFSYQLGHSALHGSKAPILQLYLESRDMADLDVTNMNEAPALTTEWCVYLLELVVLQCNSEVRCGGVLKPGVVMKGGWQCGYEVKGWRMEINNVTVTRSLDHSCQCSTVLFTFMTHVTIAPRPRPGHTLTTLTT